MIDKNDITEVISKWKVVALFNDGSMYNIEETKEIKKEHTSNKKKTFA
jgi:hypothetical protein